MEAAEKEGKKPEKGRVDFLDYFINLKKEQPDEVDDFKVISYMVLNVSVASQSLLRPSLTLPCFRYSQVLIQPL